MSIPGITHLQFLVLTILKAGEASGATIRAGLSRHAVRKSGPAFYQIMSRLEGARLVTSRHDEESRRERRYKLTGKGSKALVTTRAFYAEQLQ